MMDAITNWIKGHFGDIEYEEFSEYDDLEEETENQGAAGPSVEGPTEPQRRSGQIIAFMSGKGGAGKTSIAVNVANYYSEMNKKVLLVDCDMNTNGATAFFRTGRAELFEDSATILTFHKILLAYQDELQPANIEALNSLNLVCLNTNNSKNYHFLPANVDDGDFDEQTVANDLLQKLEEHYFSKWRTSYDVIILDFSAGGAKITEYLSKLPDKICIVMNPDGISRRIVRTRLRFVFRNCNLNNIVCCVNKRNWYKRSVNVDALFNEFPGFINSNKFKDRYVAGLMIEASNPILWRRLSKIANNVYRERVFRR